MKQKNRSGKLIVCSDGQEKILSMLYGNVFGRMLLKPLTAPCISRFAGVLLSTKASCILIRPFIRKNNIDMTQFEPARYRSYNEFFSRKIRSETRPVDQNPKHLISPCDSKLTVMPITKDCHFRLKQTEYTVQSLLKSERLACEYEGGYAMIFRLTVDDYHRYGYIADGIKEKNIKIPGILHTVNPIANDYFPIYKENSREYTILHTKEFGDLVQMEVGALLVGKIVNHHERAKVRRGQEKGYFQFGGSTVVVFVKEGIVQIDDDILENSSHGIETIVKFGEKIGGIYQNENQRRKLC